MADGYFCLRCEQGDGVFRYVDIPGGNCEEGVHVIAYQHLHGGDNQQWKWHNEQIISLILSPLFHLAAKEVKHGAPIILHSKDNENDGDSFYSKWVSEAGVIKLQENTNFCIGISDDKLVLRDIDKNSVTRWDIELAECNAKPATSCHLNYQPFPDVNVTDSWMLENTVCVRSSANSTYFCVVGWGPGGYSGIQQINEHRRVVIFSMWNDGDNSVKVIEHGTDVHVCAFGGEGTGMKAMKDVDWKENEKITFRIAGVKHNKESVALWRCSCWFSTKNNDWILMATYERPGKHPFNNHFYSFIEDWDRDNNSNGHCLGRSAEFSNAKLSAENEIFHFNEAAFTKQRNGADKFACKKAFGGIQKCEPCFILSTGGSSDTDIRELLLSKGYAQCTDTHLTKLFL